MLNEHDAPRLATKLILGFAAVDDDTVMQCEDTVR